MGRGNFAIDYAQAVLRKYPNAEAIGNGTLWTITEKLESGVRYGISGFFEDRDEAWRDAYERIVRGKNGKS